MRVIETVAELRPLLDAPRAGGRTVGLVPTMGALHEGHVSLVRRAAQECEVLVVSVFVNPLQFGAGEDLDSYPRTLDRDVELARDAGASVVFAPSLAEMYGDGTRTTVAVSGLTTTMEGAARPGHFDGVTTVVAKLLAIVGPCRAYFGEKDFQQLAVVRRMAADLSLPVAVVGCPTVREADGLAMSSRNAYLAPADRAAAPVLHRALVEGAAAIDQGQRDPAAVRRVMAGVVGGEPLARLDYAEVVTADDLTVPERCNGQLRLLVAARFGRARLIDNVGVLG